MDARLLELGVVGCWQGGSEPTGSTLLKRRQLGQLGVTVVSVPYWEWDDLKSSPSGSEGSENLKLGSPTKAPPKISCLRITTHRFYLGREPHGHARAQKPVQHGQ